MAQFLWVRYPSFQPTNHVKALEEILYCYSTILLAYIYIYNTKSLLLLHYLTTTSALSNTPYVSLQLD